MKQILKTVAVIALAAFAASCAKERIAVPSGEETLVSFTVSAPVLQTRAIADGTTVDKVVCCVYNSEGKLIENGISRTVDMSAKNATFSTRLVTGQTYSFLFWAYKSNESGESDFYTLDKTNKTVTVSYEEAVSNDENRDAFYKYIASKTITGAVNETVELTRPFAQLNFGVEIADIVAAKATDAAFTVNKSKVKVMGLGNVLNLTDGAVTVDGDVDEAGGVTAEFALAELPAGDLPVEVNADGEYTSGVLTVNDKKYGYVAMNYVLPYGNVNTELTVAKDADEINTLVVNDVPLKTNHRTNVLGNLFTSAVNLDIVVVPAFETPDIVKAVEVDDIKSANEIIVANSAADIIEVKFAAAPNDANSRAILTTPVKEDGTLSVEVSESITGTLYVGDYASAEYSADSPLQPATTDVHKATVNITIPEGVTIKTLVIDAKSKTVNINGVNVSAYTGTQIEELEAATSANTLVIENGQTIGKLIFHQGGLEIHGTVNEVTIDKKGDIFVRECENLSEDVYNALAEHIATGYKGFQGLTTEGKWDIVKTPFRLGEDKYYTSISDAIAAAGTDAATITVIWDCTFDSAVAKFAEIASGQTITIDLNGKKIVTSCSLGEASQMIFNSGTLTVQDSATGGSWTHGATPSWVYDGSDNYAGSYISNLITNHGTLYLKSGKLANISTGSASYVVDNFNDSRITISGGEYEAVNTAFRQFFGTTEMTVTGGTFVCKNGYNIVQFTQDGTANKITISGGEFTTGGWANVYSWADGTGANTSTVTVTDGIFHRYVAIGSKTNQEGFSVSGGRFYGVWNYGDGSFLSGGLFKAKPKADFVKSGYHIVDNTDSDTMTQYPWKVVAEE